MTIKFIQRKWFHSRYLRHLMFLNRIFSVIFFWGERKILISILIVKITVKWRLRGFIIQSRKCWKENHSFVFHWIVCFIHRANIHKQRTDNTIFILYHMFGNEKTFAVAVLVAGGKKQISNFEDTNREKKGHISNCNW